MLKTWLKESEGEIKTIINLMQEINWFLEKTMQVLKIDDAHKDEIKRQLKRTNNNN